MIRQHFINKRLGSWYSNKKGIFQLYFWESPLKSQGSLWRSSQLPSLQWSYFLKIDLSMF